mmetsp:Transcript_43933/g.127035  ORF Transcript_43933/g.127035 Transcript_43933/m.127035 type:complete len:333 (+) Transcript_43933:194-1192(+)
MDKAGDLVVAFCRFPRLSGHGRPATHRARFAEELELVAGAVLVLDVERRTQAAELAFHLDGNAVTQCLCLFHGVGCQDHRLAPPAHLDDLPEVALGARVHGGRGLVQEEQVGVANQCDAQAQLALHAAAVRAGDLVHVRVLEAEAVEEAGDGAVQRRLGDALDPTIKRQVLAARELIPQWVDLRAKTKGPVRRIAACWDGHVVTADNEPARAWRGHLCCEGGEGRCLTRTVRSQEPKALATADAQADAAHCGRLHPLLVDFGPVGVAQVQIPHNLFRPLIHALHDPLLLREHVLVLLLAAPLLGPAWHGRSPPHVLPQQIQGHKWERHERDV